MRAALLAFFAAASLATASLAAAQAEPDPPERYRVLVDQAIAESAEGRWSEARALFRAAHQLYPNARSLRGIGMTSFEVRDYPEAYRALRAALDSGVRPLTDEQRAEVASLLDRVTLLVGRYTVEGLPEGAELYVDGARTELATDGTLVVALGARRVEVRWPSGAAHGAWVVAGGEHGPLPIAIRQVADVAETDTDTDSDADTEADSDSDSLAEPEPEPNLEGDFRAVPVPDSDARSSIRPAGIAVLSAGAALAAVGTVLVVLGRGDIADVEDAAPGTDWDTLRDAYDRAPVRTGAGALLLGVGIAGAGAGVLMLALGKSDDDGPVTARVGLGRADLEVRW